MFSAYFGIKCWLRMDAIFSSSSTHFQNLHSQLFYALVAQAMIPIFLMHIPALTMFIFTFLNFDAGFLSGTVSLTIALFPTLDPLPTMLIFCHYRKAITNYIRTRYKKVRKTKFCRCLVAKKSRNPNSSITLWCETSDAPLHFMSAASQTIIKIITFYLNLFNCSNKSF